MSDTRTQLTATVESLAETVRTLGACDCYSDDFGPCEQHCETVAQYEGASLRSADQLVRIVLGELVTLACRESEQHNDSHSLDDCLSLTLDDDDLRTAQSYAAALDALDPFTSWVDDRELADAARSLCDDLESELPEGYSSEWDDGWRLVRITGGPLSDDESDPVWEWAEGSLEVYGTARVTPGGSSEVHSVTVVTGTGGPHVEVTFDLRSSYCRATVEGFWGGDHITRTVTASDALGSWAESYAALCGDES